MDKIVLMHSVWLVSIATLTLLLNVVALQSFPFKIDHVLIKNVFAT